jgi:short-subunit dehydrogenase
MSYWQDKVAIVTGASRGLGVSLAQAWGQQGAKVVIAARGAETLAAARAQLASEGITVESIPCDVTSDEQVDALIRRTLEKWGRIDALVNNAGVSSRGKLLATTPAEFQHSLDLNLLATVRCVRAAAEALQASRGHIVNIGSLAGKSAAKYLGPYPAAKFALSGYTQQLRLELEGQIHVLLVCPGPIARDEPRVRDEREMAGLPENLAKPGGGVKTKLIDPEALAAAVVRACEERRSELVWPAKARLLFALAQLSPSLGDKLVRRMTGSN